MTPTEWLKGMFGGIGSGWLTLSTKLDAATRQSHTDPFLTEWFELPGGLDAACAYAEKKKGCNVYFGLGVRRERLGQGQRGTARDVVALVALWADVDVGDHGNGKTYFPTVEAALEFLQHELPLPPSIVIHSGQGVHAYWEFHEPWTLADDVEHDQAARLVKWWQFLIKRNAKRVGADIDSTHDLARVLRVPGTSHVKDGGTLPVDMLWCSGKTYDPADFDQWLNGHDEEPAQATEVTAEPSGKAPDPAMLLALLANEPRFKATWERARGDFRDRSPSAYCLSLATFAAQAGWSDQQIVDLLAYWREQQGAGLKRPGWYAVTVARARSGSTLEDSEALRHRTGPKPTEKEVAQQKKVAKIGELDDPDEVLATLSDMLRVRITRVVRRRLVDERGNAAPGTYVFYTAEGCFSMDAQDLISYSKAQAIFFSYTGKAWDVSRKLWPDVLEAIHKVSAVEELPPEASPHEGLRQAIWEYADHCGSTTDPVEAHEMELTWQADGETWISLPKFLEWVRVRKGITIWFRNAPEMLGTLGSTRTTVLNTRKGSKRRRLSFWSVPRHDS